MISILKYLLVIAQDFQAQYNEILGPSLKKLSSGFASLPNELLSTIFMHSVWAEGQYGSKQAKSISHVSRTFREIALGKRAFGQCYAQMPPKRNGIHSSHVAVQRSIYIAREVEFVLKSFRRRNGGRFPRLEELDIEDGDIWPERDEHPFQVSWTSPNLRTLRCSSYIPFPFVKFDTLTTFTFSHALALTSKAVKLLKFLSSMPNLISLELAFFRVKSIRREGTVHLLPPCTCPSITSFSFSLPDSGGTSHNEAHEFIAPFLQALGLPNLEDLSISVDFWFYDSAKVEDLSRALFPVHVGHLPRTLR